MKKPNRLIHEISPYLLQHAYNPVEWFAWGPEAIAKAQSEDKPIFLSIGYSACHWCHVMERECFENDDIAAILNEHFVSIKVDREERPDLDDIYMDAVQLISGSGGWPMSMFLNTDLKPFFGGTYFPPEMRNGQRGFGEICQNLAKIWRTDRERIREATLELFEGITQSIVNSGSLSRDQMKVIEKRACDAHAAGFDSVNGGFGTAPKFPPSIQLDAMIRFETRFSDGPYRTIITRTLDAMAAGGIYDHIGGGFCRYSVDEHWRVPHFEKMLYDNALLAKVYANAFTLTRNPDYRRIATETLDYVLRNMTSPEGGFFSAQDADSDSGEGMYYLWRYDDIASLLEEKAMEFIRVFDIRKEGNFISPEACHSGYNVLYSQTLKRSPELIASLALLRSKRAERKSPGIDDKVITSWNALMISALVTAAQAFGETRFLDAAERAANFIATKLWRNNHLHRIFRKGVVKQHAMLEDWSFWGNSCLDLFQATHDEKWRALAEAAARNILNRFESNGVLYLTEIDAPFIILRKQSLWDSVIPGGASATAQLMFRLAELTGQPAWCAQAELILQAHSTILQRAPGAVCVMAGVAGAVASASKTVCSAS